MGMVLGKFCSDVDGHVMQLARGQDWAVLVHSKYFDSNTVMRAAMAYYLFGNTSNPMISMLESAQSATHMMDYAIRQGKKVSNLAYDECPGLDDVNSDRWIEQ